MQTSAAIRTEHLASPYPRYSGRWVQMGHFTVPGSPSAPQGRMGGNQLFETSYQRVQLDLLYP